MSKENDPLVRRADPALDSTDYALAAADQILTFAGWHGLQSSSDICFGLHRRHRLLCIDNGAHALDTTRMRSPCFGQLPTDGHIAANADNAPG